MFLFLALIVVLGVGAQVSAAVPAPVLGGTNDAIPTLTTNSQYQVGKGWATRVAVASPGRQFIEISNFSGATSTPQAIYCLITNQVSVATTTTLFSFPAGNPTYQGFAIQASSSKTFFRATGVPTGSVYCVNPVASSTVSVSDF